MIAPSWLLDRGISRPNQALVAGPRPKISIVRFRTKTLPQCGQLSRKHQSPKFTPYPNIDFYHPQRFLISAEIDRVHIIDTNFTY
jgi:hypothetical protein